ncbi:MAG: acyl-CoA dehydrogenase [bacterium]|nr:acyl-CoA dehydrogenase [bacterium]
MEFDETQQAMEEVIRGFCQHEIEPCIEELESGKASPFELMAKMSDALDMAGLIGSGAIGDPAIAAILAKELARVSPGFCLAVISNLGCGATIATRGSAELVARCGLPVLSLKKVGCWALTESESGSDAFSLKTTARIEGDEVVLNGSKAFSSNAPAAEVLLIYARLAGGEKNDKSRIFPVVVERGTPGLETGPPLEKFGMHISPTGDIFLDDVRVPRENLLGDPDRPARTTAEQTLASERIVIVAMCLGVIERCIEEAIAHAKERVQFGKPIAAFQLTQQKFARMYVAQENVRNSMFALIDAQEAGTISEKQVSAAKWYATEAAAAAALDAMQIMGGAGYLREHAPERLFRDIKLWTIGGGTSEIQQLTIAKDLLRQHGFGIDLAGGYRTDDAGA